MTYDAPAASGLEGLAGWIAANYMGAGKSAQDVLPELRRKGITASGNSFVINGQYLDAAGVAQAMRLQVCVCVCVCVSVNLPAGQYVHLLVPTAPYHLSRACDLPAHGTPHNTCISSS